MIKSTRILQTILLTLTLSLPATVHSANGVIASGEASEESVEAAIHLISATTDLSAAGLVLGSNLAIELGRPIANVLLTSAEISMDSVAFSSDVLADGLITTAMLSSELAHAGIALSADAVQLAALSTKAGMALSAETAALFLNQAVNIAATSGRLSGELAVLATTLTRAGVMLSLDSAKLISDAAASGIVLSVETAAQLINGCLQIADQCIQAAVLAERYMIMTLAEANQLLKETSLATVAAALKTGHQAVQFSGATINQLRQLGVDSAKYARELSRRAATGGVKATALALTGANDAVVVVINTGAGLIVATLEALTTAAQNGSRPIQ